MKPDTHKLQPDPPEGSRKTVEKELKRQRRKSEGDTENKTDRPGFDLGGAKEEGGSATNPVSPVDKGRGETGRASGYGDPSGSR